MTDNPKSTDSIETPSGPHPISTIGREVLTFLECAEEGKIATKRFKTLDYIPMKTASKCTWWKPLQYAVNDLWGAYELFSKLSDNPRIMHVRGALIDPKKKRMLRRHKRRGDEEPTLTAKGRYLNWIDIDGVEIPGLDPLNPWPALHAWVRSIKVFKNADIIIHLSSSWGIKEEIHIHLGYWADRPLADKEARAFAESLPFSIDASLYTPSQPFYCADPLFSNDTFDPLLWESRWSFVACDEGTGEVHVDTGMSADELKHWLGRIAELGDGTPRHTVINSAAYFLGRYVKGGVWSTDELTAKLVEACVDSGAFDEERIGAAEDEIRRAIADGIVDTVEEIGSWRDRAHRREEGGFKSDMFNLLLFLREHPKLKGSLRFDRRRERQEWMTPPPWEREGTNSYPRAVADADAIEAAGWFNDLGMTFTDNNIHKAFEAVALDASWDAVETYLKGLEWDGIERCRYLYQRGGGAEEGVWTETMSLLTIDILVCRALNWGCKADTMPIMQGAREGTGKSTFFKLLVGGVDDDAGEYFSDAMGDYGSNQKFGEALNHYWLVEDGELAKLQSRELEAVMRQLSSRKDVYRPAYGRKVREKLRSCLLVGTTNLGEFLDSTRINRRLPVIICTRPDWAWVVANRDQIFAEARMRYERGIAKPYLTSEEIDMQIRENAEFGLEDPWEEPIRDYLDGKTTGVLNFEEVKKNAVTAAEVLRDAIGVPIAQQNKAHALRVGKILRKLGWEARVIRTGDKTMKRFVSSSATDIGLPAQGEPDFEPIRIE
jgi:predicted P-loop ATPase